MSRTHHHSRKWFRDHPFNLTSHLYLSSTPSWWTRLFMNRPKRLASRRLLRLIAQDRTDPDDAAHPLGSRKPHVYYW